VFVPAHNAAGDDAEKAEEAIRRGAVAIVSERMLPVSVPQCLVEDTRVVYSRLRHALIGNPSQRMLTVAVVGTHGKTTTSLFLAAMLKRMAGAVAYYTSLGSSDSVTCDRSTVRAPGTNKLAHWLKQADSQGAPSAVIEVTPAMLYNHVTAGIEFDLVVLTSLRPGQFAGSPTSQQLANLTQNCLKNLKPHGVVLANNDDAHVASFCETLDSPVAAYGLDAGKQVRGKRLDRAGGQQQVLAIAGNLMMPLTLKIPGDHVARASLAALTASWVMDLSIPEAIAAIESLETIPGRMQRIVSAVDVPLFIDQAQTPDRLAVALHALRCHHFGPATVVMDIGNHLPGPWRQRLGEVLSRHSHQVILTASDICPEAAQSLAMDVLGGCNSPGRVQVIPDRQAAIRWAVRHTQQGCILLAGCGVNNWVNRDGEEISDESVAKQAISQCNQVPSLPKLSIFPPSSASEFFSR
jgi:UDP-N-acetylmuramoyl-L-alanyl-D-glutamate--2,6-diaminopimelate ligase